MESRMQRKIEAELLDMADAEAMTGRSRWSWRRDCYSGVVTSVKIGRRLFLPVSEVHRVIAENIRFRVISPAPAHSAVLALSREQV
jgi:hypothetical protein